MTGQSHGKKSQSDVLVRLQNWYSGECDGDWEHLYGVKIDTLDNPGWVLDIDIWETELSGRLIGRFLRKRSEEDWLDFNISESKFYATGGVNNLYEMIEQFLYFTKNFQLIGDFDVSKPMVNV